MRYVKWLACAGLLTLTAACADQPGYYPTSYGYSSSYYNGYYGQPTYYRSQPIYYGQPVAYYSAPTYYRPAISYAPAPAHHHHHHHHHRG